MAIILTIAIPTYNRAAELDRQLYWIAQELGTYWSEVCLKVFDNASSDNTAEVCERWQKTIGPAHMQYVRNQKNLGTIGNYRLCVENAASKFVWVLSDDDEIVPGYLIKALGILRKTVDLTVLASNFRHVPVDRRDQLGHARYSLTRDIDSLPGFSIFELLTEEEGWGALLFISGIMVHADLARLALATWGADSRNLALPLYVAGFACARGRAVVSAEVSVNCIVGAHSWAAECLRLEYYDVVQVLARLNRQGFSREFLRKTILKHLNTRPSAVIRFALKFPWSAVKSIALYFFALYPFTTPKWPENKARLP